MKYKIHIYDLERTVQERKITEDEEIKELKEQYSKALKKAEKDIDAKHALSGEEKQLLHNIAHKVGKVNSGGKGGINLEFDDYKKIIETMVKFTEEMNWAGGKELGAREARRAILAGGKKDEYWECLKKQKIV